MRRSSIPIAAVLSGAAVALSLIFVGFEISQNTAAQRSASLAEIASLRFEFNMGVWTDDTMPDLLSRITRGGVLAADLTPVEVLRANSFFISYLRIQEAAYRQVQVGVISEEDYNVVSPVFSYPLFREQWPGIRPYFSPTFAESIENGPLR